MKNNKLLAGVAGGIAFVIYNILVFTFAGEKTPVFWWAYAFTMLAFLLQAVTFIFSYKKNTTVKDVFFGIPLTAISLTYLSVQIVVSAVFMILSGSSLKVANVVQIILLAVYLFLAISALFAKNTVESIAEKTKGKILFIKLLENDVVSLQDRINDPAIQTRLASLSELIRYSDPMSHPSLALLEQKASNKITALTEKAEAGKMDEANELFDEIENLIAERNRKCKLLK